MAKITQETMKAAASLVREEDLQELETLKNDLFAKADQARNDGRLFVMAQYTRLIAMIAPEIKRIRDRFDRETLAAIRKEYKQLKAEHGDDQDASS